MAANGHVTAFVVTPASNYLSETRDLLPCPRSDPAFDASKLATQATASDLVLFVKPGCGHCARAELATADFGSRRTLVTLPSTASRQALARKLGLPMLTVPVAFVKGRCVGDGQALHALLAGDGGSSGGSSGSKGQGSAHTERLAAMLTLPMAADPFAPGVSDTAAWTERHLCRPPGGAGRFGCENYFLNTYGNTVRAVSAAHVICFLLLAATAGPAVAAPTRALVWLLVADLALLTLSTNASPLALAATSALWPRRGPVVPAIPYKVIFVLYMVSLVRVGTGVSSEAEVRAAALSAALNSAFLAVLRFWPGSSLVAAVLWPATYLWRQCTRGCQKRGRGAAVGGNGGGGGDDDALKEESPLRPAEP